MIAGVETNKGAKGSNSKKMTYNRRKTRRLSVFPPFSYRTKQVVALSEQWIKDAIRLAEVEFLPSAADLKDPKYCPFQKKKDTRWNSASFLEISSTRSTEQMKSYSKKQYQESSISKA